MKKKKENPIKTNKNAR